MKYGCIGEHLKHSFSKEIHGHIADYDYTIKEIPKDGIDAFMKAAKFTAINVTIPYKETVIPYLAYIDESAKLIGAVNTIVNKNGKLYGYNTDFYGMSMLASHAKISFSGKKVLILGTGGTSKTAYAVAKAHGAEKIIKASRKASDDAVLYSDIYKYHTDAQIIINTTPVGMFPNNYEIPIDIKLFPNLTGVLDAVYNPLRTPLILEAQKLGIPAEGGLYMLVAQGVRASEIFLDTKYSDNLLDEIYSKILSEKENIILIGMPASGKTTVSKILKEKLARAIFDSDEEIEKFTKRTIPDIFEKDGEASFRDIESDMIKNIAKCNSSVIATGGGVVLRCENTDALRENGKIYFLDRPLELLIPTSDRPTASSKEAIKARYSERISIYRSSADVIIPSNSTPEEAAEKIIKDFLKL